MIGRRHFALGLTGTLGTSGLMGCGHVRHFFQPEVSRTTIDIHTHFFNGRDVPVVGFLKQTVIRDPHAPVDQDMVSDAFFKLLKAILLINTPTAHAELEHIGGQVTPAPPEVILARDQENVAKGITQFAHGVGRETAGLTTSRSAEEAILDRIATEVGAPELRSSLHTMRAQGSALANRIYQTARSERQVPGEEHEYVHRSPLMQTIRWAGLLTRPRLDILAELDRLYGGPGLIRVFSPSLVDFGAWFITEETVTPIEDQIDLVAAIARRYTDALVLPFAPFCPLRAALEREDNPQIDPLRHVKRAVLELGFAGIKLYPPMGFRPVGNASSLSWVPRKPQGGAAMLDHELEALYLWCIENEVPIKAHANNSIAAGPNTGSFADPAGWAELLRDPRFRNLQLNLAHFGGFDETAPRGLFPSPGDWEETLADMVEEFPNLYFDLGYWTEATQSESDQRARVIARTRVLFDRSPQMVERMMYGSDWSMIGREPGHPAYLAGVLSALKELGLDEAATERVMGGNAGRYLGLDRNGRQRARLNAAYADHPVYQAIFDRWTWIR
ncbi:amidohydrolase family protein [Alloyangia pacifica]|uniref:amidohydrolase family protein n=1 Tax=Alloyangia pacifica TaxID=311180 RepID=UPI001CFE2498|nr:amidohydrolase family protein [Alloyangia pacifica]